MQGPRSNLLLINQLRLLTHLRLDDTFALDAANAGTRGHEEEDMANWQEWTPDPRDAASAGGGSSSRTADIISMLINIYGSREMFVDEYRSLLSNRLLAATNYESDREIRNLELLKLRFGEAPLQQCEVMLKDVTDSKRINTLLHSEVKEGEAAASGGGSRELQNLSFPVNGLVLSAQFWPPFKEETLQLPEEIQVRKKLKKISMI